MFAQNRRYTYLVILIEQLHLSVEMAHTSASIVGKCMVSNSPDCSLTKKPWKLFKS